MSRGIAFAMTDVAPQTVKRERPVYPFGKTTPEIAQTMEVAPGIHWLRMPLHFSLAWINLWLIDDGSAWTIVDTGMPLEETKAAWQTIFDEKLDGSPVKRIIVTHMHPDHIGNAGWLHRETGAELWISRLEYVTCRMLCADTGREAPVSALEFYRRAGWTTEALQDYKDRFGRFGKGVSPLPDHFY
ncbi:MAG: MBL fold metallo-hydrolase, partial [Pseudomonadota bacterium]